MNTALQRIKAWTGCNKQYWEGVAICREYGNLQERELRLLNMGMTGCHQEETINAEIANIKRSLTMWQGKQSDENLKATSQQKTQSPPDVGKVKRKAAG